MGHIKNIYTEHNLINIFKHNKFVYTLIKGVWFIKIDEQVKNNI